MATRMYYNLYSKLIKNNNRTAQTNQKKPTEEKQSHGNIMRAIVRSAFNLINVLFITARLTKTEQTVQKVMHLNHVASLSYMNRKFRSVCKESFGRRFTTIRCIEYCKFGPRVNFDGFIYGWSTPSIRLYRVICDWCNSRVWSVKNDQVSVIYFMQIWSMLSIACHNLYKIIKSCSIFFSVAPVDFLRSTPWLTWVTLMLSDFFFA